MSVPRCCRYLQGVDRQFAAGAEHTGIGKPRDRVDAGVGPGLHCAQIIQATVGGDHQLPGLSAHHASVANADSMFGSHQHDLLAVHAPERAHIQREDGRITAGGNRLYPGVVGTDLIGACSDLKLPRPDPGISLHRAGYQIRVVRGTGVHALAVNLDCTALNAITLQRTAIDDRPACGDGGPVSVDEAATVAGNTRRVGDDELRPVASDFNIPVEPARVAGVDFIEDDPGGTSRQPRITLYPAAKLRLRVRAGVVENGALLPDIELPVGIARNAGPAGVWILTSGTPLGASSTVGR